MSGERLTTVYTIDTIKYLPHTMPYAVTRRVGNRTVTIKIIKLYGYLTGVRDSSFVKDVCYTRAPTRRILLDSKYYDKQYEIRNV